MINYFLSFILAALPPFEQSNREMRSILMDRKLYELIGSGESILEIKREEGGYVVTTSKHKVWVEVQYLPNHSGRLGPVEYNLVFHPPVGNNN